MHQVNELLSLFEPLRFIDNCHALVSYLWLLIYRNDKQNLLKMFDM